MKIYQPGKNTQLKVLGLLAIFAGLIGFIVTGIQNNSNLLLCIGLALTVMGIWTCLGKFEKYIDVKSRKVVTSKKWLWFSWGNEIPLSQYKYISIVKGNPRTYADPAYTNPEVYNVNLVGKNEVTDHSGTHTINMWLGGFNIKDGGREKALSYAHEISEKIEIPINSNKRVN